MIWKKTRRPLQLSLDESRRKRRRRKAGVERYVSGPKGRENVSYLVVVPDYDNDRPDRCVIIAKYSDVSKAESFYTAWTESHLKAYKDRHAITVSDKDIEERDERIRKSEEEANALRKELRERERVNLELEKENRALKEFTSVNDEKVGKEPDMNKDTREEVTAVDVAAMEDKSVSASGMADIKVGEEVDGRGKGFFAWLRRNFQTVMLSLILMILASVLTGIIMKDIRNARENQKEKTEQVVQVQKDSAAVVHRHIETNRKPRLLVRLYRAIFSLAVLLVIVGVLFLLMAIGVRLSGNPDSNTVGDCTRTGITLLVIAVCLLVTRYMVMF